MGKTIKGAHVVPLKTAYKSTVPSSNDVPESFGDSMTLTQRRHNL